MRNLLLGLAAMFAVLALIGAASGGAAGHSAGSGSAGSGRAGSGSAAGTARPPAGPHIGSKVRDGKFQFVITRVGHARSAGTGLLRRAAQGEYTVLAVRVTNIAAVAQTLTDAAQYVYDASGRRFSADTRADIIGNSPGDQVYLDQVNPGDSVAGSLYFDLPPGVRAVRAVLHDSFLSGGVSVALIPAG
ncbi:MAG TPA: DUF4352 domain-containing protein [Streptosporangiaceae bacterium]